MNKKYYSYLLVFLVASLGSFFVSDYFNSSNSEKTTNISPTKNQKIEEIALIFIGCSKCPAANEEKLIEVFSEISNMLQQYALERDLGYLSLGLSNETNVEQGLNYLQDFYNFDEISLGNGMGNNSFQRYIWDNFTSTKDSATPQVMITKRIYQEGSDQRTSTHPRIIDEVVLVKKIGLQEIASLRIDPFFKSQ